MIINPVPAVRMAESVMRSIRETMRGHFTAFLIGISLCFLAWWLVTLLMAWDYIGISPDMIRVAGKDTLFIYSIRFVDWMNNSTGIAPAYVWFTYTVSRAGENFIWVGALFGLARWWINRKEWRVKWTV